MRNRLRRIGRDSAFETRADVQRRKTTADMSHFRILDASAAEAIFTGDSMHAPAKPSAQISSIFFRPSSDFPLCFATIQRCLKNTGQGQEIASLTGLLTTLSRAILFPRNAETFRNPRHIPIPSNPLQVGTADFNGDGRPDFYYVDASGLNVILANSDGSYAAPQTTPLGSATPQPADFARFAGSCRAADFNGDGFADAVCFTPDGQHQAIARHIHRQWRRNTSSRQHTVDPNNVHTPRD